MAAAAMEGVAKAVAAKAAAVMVAAAAAAAAAAVMEAAAAAAAVATAPAAERAATAMSALSMASAPTVPPTALPLGALPDGEAESCGAALDSENASAASGADDAWGCFGSGCNAPVDGGCLCTGACNSPAGSSGINDGGRDLRSSTGKDSPSSFCDSSSFCRCLSFFLISLISQNGVLRCRLRGDARGRTFGVETERGKGDPCWEWSSELTGNDDRYWDATDARGLS
mmetsp:Transcript_5947/g.18947  ORF Transcript_5947/g.18947 Transcript_5947/m.18947 type:complete len:227 (-) Transcript_5947:473-1153(-)